MSEFVTKRAPLKGKRLANEKKRHLEEQGMKKAAKRQKKSTSGKELSSDCLILLVATFSDTSQETRLLLRMATAAVALTTPIIPFLNPSLNCSIILYVDMFPPSKSCTRSKRLWVSTLRPGHKAWR